MLRRCPRQPPAVPVVGLVKPRLLGVVHQYGFFAAPPAGTVLVIRAPTPTAVAAAAVYAASVCGLFGVSALPWTGSEPAAGARPHLRRASFRPGKI
jgi:hemolysin III